MRIGQNYSPLKSFSKFILVALVGIILNCSIPSYYSQTVIKEASGKLFQPEKPLKPCWSLPSENFDGSKIASDNESLLVPSLDGKLISINSKNGLTNWDTDFGGNSEMAANPSISDRAVFTVSNTKIERDKTLNESGELKRLTTTVGKDSPQYTIRRLDKETGVVIWQTLISDQGKNKAEIIEGENFGINKIQMFLSAENLIVSTSFGEIYLLDSSDGKIKNQLSLGVEISAVPSFSHNQFTTFGSERRIFVISTRDISKIAGFEVDDKPTSILEFGGRLVWGNKSGTVNSIPAVNNSLNGKTTKWKLRTGGEIINLELSGKIIIVTSLDNYVYAVSLLDGKLLWKKRLPNRPAFNSLVIEGYVILTTVGDSTVIFIEMKAGKTVNKISISDKLFYTGVPQIVGSMIILPTSKGLLTYTSEKICGE